MVVTVRTSWELQRSFLFITLSSNSWHRLSYQTLTGMEAPQMSMIRRDSKGSLEMWGAMYSMGTIALQEPAHSEGIVATQAQREEGRVVLVHGRRENWEEQVALGGTMDLWKRGHNLNFSIGLPARTLTGQISEEAGRQGDPSVWSMPVSLGAESRAGSGSKGAAHCHSALTH